jgi:hypothetical protein
MPTGNMHQMKYAAEAPQRRVGVVIREPSRTGADFLKRSEQSICAIGVRLYLGEYEAPNEAYGAASSLRSNPRWVRSADSGSLRANGREMLGDGPLDSECGAGVGDKGPVQAGERSGSGLNRARIPGG